MLQSKKLINILKSCSVPSCCIESTAGATWAKFPNKYAISKLLSKLVLFHFVCHRFYSIPDKALPLLVLYHNYSIENWTRDEILHKVKPSAIFVFFFSGIYSFGA